MGRSTSRFSLAKGCYLSVVLAGALAAVPLGSVPGRTRPVTAPAPNNYALLAGLQVQLPENEPDQPNLRKLERKQKKELLKSNFEKMQQDARELADLAKSLQDDLDKSNENVLSLKIVDRADKIEKLARKIKNSARGL